ncbi:hypothetical protein K432DRAFT_410810 [Lepidopterella palustris CBS 459.81]|uniref:Uncharacterized protein n=1 Tax=Lepidopterella palustris CBS 459.81 TaxID=1314670 RepID=A0A8E2J8I7_9PEZI|nr:hypothetical protein K432DRAFT_410810 [Lepidopterella palustris CBS 459.81]
MADLTSTDNSYIVSEIEGRLQRVGAIPLLLLDKRLAAAKARYTKLIKLKILEKLEAEIEEIKGYTLAPNDDSILPDINIPKERKGVLRVDTQR